MTNEEAKDALYKRIPVTYNGIEYLCLSAIIYRFDQNAGLSILAELRDKSKNSVTIANVKDVTAYDKENQTAVILS